ncbi:MAG: acetyl-CoA carboxylase biotin carboxyl carrier protein [Puniceicoccales bacterium]|jgi:acetyl-CoA carboxylase biotin carboxyl carrier protein|nr:acetyl-CoA carboxylase biotin carboxyl carrier protein [Puniceicoccales bacterium]
MNIEEIKRLAKIMTEVGVTEIEIEEKGYRIRLAKQSPIPSITALAPSSFTAITTPTEIPSLASAPTSSPVPEIPTMSLAKDSEPHQNCQTISSPMIGTFYRSASPESGPLVNIGDTVKVNTPVCILEAMKIMNEILSDVEGTIIDIPIKNGEPVEFGQVLFYVQPTTVTS